MDNNKKVVSIHRETKGKESIEITEEDTVLFINGEPIFLEEFIIAGQEVDRSLIAMTSKCSIETSLFYKEVLGISIREEMLSRLSRPED